MQQYLDTLRLILKTGLPREDRTGVGTIGIFGHQMRFDLMKGFPLVTTKKLFTKAIIHELLWMISGSTNVKDLQKHGVTIWDEWAQPSGDLGPVYGAAWRRWPGSPYVQQQRSGDDAIIRDPIDQLANVVQAIRKNPYSRRHIVTAWNPENVEDCALPPCHCFFQFYVTAEAHPRLSCQLYQRSADVFLGVPFNIASYALLTMIVANLTGYLPGEFIHTFGDLHLYRNHIEQANIQLTREPLPLPDMWLNEKVTSLDGYSYDDFQLSNYRPHPAIQAAVAV